MPQQYTRAQLLEAVRADHPQFKTVDDNALWQALGTDHPELVKGVVEASPSPDKRTPGQVAVDQIRAVSRGGAQALNPLNIPSQIKMLVNMFSQGPFAAPFTPEAHQLVRGMAQPFQVAAQGAQALATTPKAGLAGRSPYTQKELGMEPTGPQITAPSREEFEQAAEGAGALGVGAALGALIPKVPALAKYAGRKLTTSQALEARAGINTARALRPVTLEGQAIAQQIAPELGKHMPARITGKRYDASIAQGLDEATTQLNKVHDRLVAEPRPEFQIDRAVMIDEIDGALNKLARHPDIHKDAIVSLRAVRREFARLPRFASFKDVLDLRQALDTAVEEAGGFKAASSTADRVKMQALRGGADVARKYLNELDPALKAANQEYALYRHAADIVERRQLGDVGKTGMGLPGRANLLDDILAGWAGNAVAGPAGAAVAEGLNLARQSRGYAAIKARGQQQLADFLRLPKRQPAGLLTAGNLQLPAPETSSVRGVPAEAAPATRVIRSGRLLTAGNLQLPAPETSSVRGVPAEAAPATRVIRSGRLLKAGLPLPPGSEPPSGGFKMEVTTGPPLIPKAGSKPVTIPIRKGLAIQQYTDPVTGAVHRVLIDTRTGKILKDFQ